MEATVAISSDFLTSFTNLPKQTQGKVTDFINKFRLNPKNPGINYEKINGAADKKMHSVRIDLSYRGIVAKQEKEGAYILLYIDKHDDAYKWAERHKCEINPRSGSLQIFQTIYEETPENMSVSNFSESSAPLPLFSNLSDDQLLSLLLPSELISLVRKVSDLNSFYALKGVLPDFAYENLEMIASGFSYSDVYEYVEDHIDKMKISHIYSNHSLVNKSLLPFPLLSKIGPMLRRLTLGRNANNPADLGNDDFGTIGDNLNISLVKALKQPLSGSSFHIIEGQEELDKIMNEPLEKWRVFLHPTQKALVHETFSGPALVLGGAGTGKTVVAMHRAKYLASLLSKKERLLFTTFTANLAADIKENLSSLCTIKEFQRIEVLHVDALASRFLSTKANFSSIAYGDNLHKIWEEALSLSHDSEFSAKFLSDEWANVAAIQDNISKESYLNADRKGRENRLDHEKRLAVWNVFDKYIGILNDRKQRDINYALYECRKIAEKALPKAAYKAIVIDEAQDLSENAFRLLRTLAGLEHENDMFIAGDSHQRIYKHKVSLSKCGINVKGRVSHLRINYRTTEEIHKYAYSLLKDIKFDNLDEDSDFGMTCQSLTHGDPPLISKFKDVSEELNFIVQEIKKLTSGESVDFKDICVVARKNSLLDAYKNKFMEEGINFFEIKKDKVDDQGLDGVRIATLHRVKGLEFEYVFIVAANNLIIPLESAIDRTSELSEAESLTGEKSLLYVALTRARKNAYVTGYGELSPFLAPKD
jgi:superfamily I DNA/RNA helicase/mRNA-degrading endonuclease RelE of RelBE toxin-antitoxin system